ncbi:hypothetical protein HNP82_001140 [Catenibacillus scindens]|uniref:Uncharacterized protein n=1 Tax=Catenibacillus scindens TaxID=673271 RepID=A0A7W8HAB9_9FIRM|nr:hypothetical protein [Catenibacillus scindens]
MQYAPTGKYLPAYTRRSVLSDLALSHFYSTFTIHSFR